MDVPKVRPVKSRSIAERCAEGFQPIVDALLYLPSCSKRKDHRVEIIHDPMGALNALGSRKKILIK